jgi:hypothetical protein|tara:strand:- start:3587 stop:3823 length:237 start_codon:yes stop_codon:yes gene_type:complete
MKIVSDSRRWKVLNYVVSEPGEWTCRSITTDLDENFHGITEAMISLVRNGMIVKGEKVGRSHTLVPTPIGVEALYRAL